MLAFPIELSPVAVALSGAVSYGGGDFLGGRAAVRLSPSGAVAIAQCTAMILTVQVFLGGSSEFNGQHVAVSGIIAGIAYAIGIMFLYQGIAMGRIAVVVPVCGVMGILVPLLGDVLLGRPLSVTELLGIGICALAIVLVSKAIDTPDDGHTRHFSFRIGAISGVGYGSADLMLGAMSTEDSAASLMVARTVAALISIGLICAAIIKARGFGSDNSEYAGIAGGLAWVQRPNIIDMVPYIALAMVAGVLDTIGHMSYVHVATQGGSMAVASALVALFPAVVVALAVLFLRERIQSNQYLGLIASLFGIVVLSI